MGRHKSKRKQVNRPNRMYSDPKWEYVYGPDRPTIEELSERWRHKKSCTIWNLNRRANREEWTRLRKDAWAKIEQETAERLERNVIERRTKAVQEASGRHIEVGKTLQGIGYKDIKIAEEKLKDKEEVKKQQVTDLQRTATRMMVDGVTVERKGLGLEDQVVNVYFVRDITVKLLTVIQKFVTDPVVYRSIKRGFRDLVSGEEDKVKEAIDGGKKKDDRGKYTKKVVK